MAAMKVDSDSLFVEVIQASDSEGLSRKISEWIHEECRVGPNDRHIFQLLQSQSQAPTFDQMGRSTGSKSVVTVTIFYGFKAEQES